MRSSKVEFFLCDFTTKKKKKKEKENKKKSKEERKTRNKMLENKEFSSCIELLANGLIKVTLTAY